jgi:GNAT superfamily N-acetyltransferase
MRTALDVTWRGFRESDYEGVARLHTLAYPESPTTAGEVRDWVRERTGPGLVSEWVIAEDQRTGAIVGCVWYHQVIWSFSPYKYRLRGYVHPDHERRGIGRQLLEAALESLRARGGQRVLAIAREDQARSVAFLQRAGFTERVRDFESRLAVAACDLARFADSGKTVGQSGVELTTLADELARDANCLRAVYQAHYALEFGAPREDPDPPTPRPFAQFVAVEIEHPTVLPAAYFLAKRGDVIVGESAVKRSAAEAGVLHQELTAVLPEYRGRGVATALKVLTIQYAQEQGFREIRTLNSSHNAPMLAINAKLGFIRQPAWIQFQLPL